MDTIAYDHAAPPLADADLGGSGRFSQHRRLDLSHLVANGWEQPKVGKRTLYGLALAAAVAITGVAGYEMWPKSLAAVVSDVSPAVFSVKTVLPDGSYGIGSAFLIDTKGHLLTANHVSPEKSSKIYVTSANGVSIEAELVGTDERTDISVLQIPASMVKGITPLSWGNYPIVGDPTIVIGSPFGLQGSVSQGIISTIHRVLDEDQGGSNILDYLQTDAAVNPGNSGGPLFNRAGQTIGFLDAIFAPRTHTNDGISLAIPATITQKVAADLIAYGEVKPGLPRFSFEDDLPKPDDIKDKLAPMPLSKGARIKDVKTGSAADLLGLKSGDVVVNFDQTAIKTARDLRLAFYMTHPGETHEVFIRRDSKIMKVLLPMGGDAVPEHPTHPPEFKKLLPLEAHP